jgi:hypothetical protein
MLEDVDPELGEVLPRERRTWWSAAELLAEEFPEPSWAVPGIVAEGLNLLVGAPKLGKSWFALNIGVAIAAGGLALGSLDVDQGDVLYLALEDPPRRMQDRLRKVLGDSSPSPRLTIAVQCEPLSSGGLSRVDSWLREHPAARLVIVDVYARIRGQVDVRADRYAADYLAMARFKALADEHRVAILLVHHTRKQDATDFVDMASGTSGLTGAADTILLLNRSRNSCQAVLKVTGRDVQEAEYALELDVSAGKWTMLDAPAGEVGLSDARQQILAVLREADAALTPKEIARRSGVTYDVVRRLVRRMAEARQLATDGGGHYAPFTLFTAFTDEEQ